MTFLTIVSSLAFQWLLTVLLYDTWPDPTAHTTVHLTLNMNVHLTVQSFTLLWRQLKKLRPRGEGPVL